MARFKEQLPIQSMDLSSGASQGLMSLANRLESFKNFGSEMLQDGLNKRREGETLKGIRSGSTVEIKKKNGKTSKKIAALLSVIRSH